MSNFLIDTHRLACTSPQFEEARESKFEKVGRSLACELIECLRLGHWEGIDSLQAALAIVKPAGPEVMRGFLRELTDAIREEPQ